MKLLQIDRDALLTPLQAVTGIVEKRHTLPILSNVLIERKNEMLHLVATDLEIQITTSEIHFIAVVLTPPGRQRGRFSRVRVTPIRSRAVDCCVDIALN